ncbi:hypothetical protein ABL78_0812 [Leptomonas seymouri]|uniref:Uncharacterized protein n=1 Tax=Leptomonas seymouri TaxID=5684 RepID=A0A0N0P8L0_LEPSE|nr:hypothetical protein ABL78_0812 [Leptomonas seymouri]|eukprot:KPI90059.1 hypothetical protein ABL78_0812 [Leptomonas seymouri]
MQSKSRGASVEASPSKPESLRLDKNGDCQSSRRGSGALWVCPVSSGESHKMCDKGTPASQQNSVQTGDFSVLSPDSSSILSGCETVAPQPRDSCSDRPDRRGPYGLLAGLLSRRGGGGRESRSRKSASNGRKQRSESPSRLPQTSMGKRSSCAARHPLLEAFEGTDNSLSTDGTHIGAGGYEWPNPPSPIKNSGSLHPTTNSSRQELPIPAGRGEWRDRRSSSRFPDHGESHFVPLGSTNLDNRGRSASVQRPEIDDANGDEALSTSVINGRTILAGRRKLQSQGGLGPGGSTSTSASQSNEQLAHTRGSQARLFGVDDSDASTPLSTSTAKGMRDAKAALLRHAQGASASARTSHMQSFCRVPSIVGGPVDSAVMLSHRSGRARGTSRERRNLNCSRSGIGRDDVGSLYSLAFDDDAVRMSVSPCNMESPLLVRQGGTFHTTAACPEGNMTSTSHVGMSRRLSRTDDVSGAIVEVMETSTLTSRGNVGGCSNTNTCSSGISTRGRSKGSIAAPSNGRHGNNTSREDDSYLPSICTYTGSYHPKHRHMANGGYDDDEDGLKMEERHRQKVDEVLRRLNRPQKSAVGNNLSSMSQAAASEAGGTHNEVVSVLNTSAGHSTGDNGTSGTCVDNNNSISVGGGVTWSCIGGLGWGSLTGFGAAAAESTTDEAATGKWSCLGGDGGSEDWYARMRKKAAEEEAAEAAAAEDAASTAVADANAKFVSPGTMSITAGPGLLPGSILALSSATADLSSTYEVPMPSVTCRPGAQRSPMLASVLSPKAHLPLTPTTKPTTSTSRPVPPTQPPTSARTPIKPPTSSTTPEKGVTHLLSSAERFVRRPPGGASRAEKQQQQLPKQQQKRQRNTGNLKFVDSPTHQPMEATEGVVASAPTLTVKSDSVVSGSMPCRRSTPLGTTTPSHRRFDSRRRSTLLRLLPASATNGGATGVTNSVVNVPSTDPLQQSASTNEGSVLPPDASCGTFAEESTQPSPPPASAPCHVRRASTQMPARTTTTVDARHSNGTSTSIGVSQHSSPGKNTITVPLTAPPTESAGLTPQNLPCEPTPRMTKESA